MTTYLELEIDDDLIQQALQIGEQQTKQAVVEAALREYVQRRKQTKIIELFGSIDYEEGYDYRGNGSKASPF